VAGLHAPATPTFGTLGAWLRFATRVTLGTWLDLKHRAAGSDRRSPLMLSRCPPFGGPGAWLRSPLARCAGDPVWRCP
jgi:hypothetical protein